MSTAGLASLTDRIRWLYAAAASITAVVIVVFAAACTAGTVTDSDGPLAPPSDTTTNPGGTVQRATLTVHVWIVEPADSSIAAVAGVTTTGLTVRLMRDLSSDAPRTAVVGADGTVRFEGLLQGTYQVSVDRALTPVEIARLAPEDRDASIFSGGASVFVSPPARLTDILLVAARRGSLVLSEVFIYAAYVPMVGNNGHYMEVYNNADTTIYLDGILVFRTEGGLHTLLTPNATRGLTPCAWNDEKRLDPTGIWASVIHRFPGSGREYPIGPGEAKVVALDAVNHGAIGAPDLSRAEFELIGNDADPNNPYAADMIGMTRYRGAMHGEPFTHNILVGLALPIAQDTTQLARAILLYNAWDRNSVFKIPRGAVLDVAGFRSTPEKAALMDSHTCEPFASPVFERAEAQLVDMDVPMAISRKSLGRTALGAEILQRTHTAARDFQLASPLFRSLFK